MWEEADDCDAERGVVVEDDHIEPSGFESCILSPGSSNQSEHLHYSALLNFAHSRVVIRVDGSIPMEKILYYSLY